MQSRSHILAAYPADSMMCLLQTAPLRTTTIMFVYDRLDILSRPRPQRDASSMVVQRGKVVSPCHRCPFLSEGVIVNVDCYSQSVSQ